MKKILKCPICKSNNSRVIYKNMTDLYLNHSHYDNFDLVQCNICDVSFINPVPTNKELVKYYPLHYAPYNKKNKSFLSYLKNLFIFPYILRYGFPDAIEKPYGNKNFLDIGCGSGNVLFLYSKLGWNCYGIDNSAHAIKQAKLNNPKAFLKKTTFEKFKPNFLFTYITMSHFLEHTPKPVEIISKTYEILDSNGTLEISVPNRSGIESKIFKNKWIGYDVPRHLYTFSEKSIINILLKAGFKEITLKPDFFPTSFSESLILLLPKKWRERIWNSKLAKTIYWICLFPVSLSYLFGNKSVIRIRAKK